MKPRTGFIERCRIEVDTKISPSEVLKQLLVATNPIYRRFPNDMRIRVSHSFKQAFIKQEASEMGDLAEVFTRHAQKHFNLLYGGITLVVDGSIRHNVALDTIPLDESMKVITQMLRKTPLLVEVSND